MKILGIISVRLNSERFNNKLLYKIEGLSIIERVVLNALRIKNINKIVLAVPDKKTIDCLSDIIYRYNLKTIITGETTCGSERVFSVYQQIKDYDYYITIPADEPFIEPEEVDKTIRNNIKKLDENIIYTMYDNFYYKDRLKSNLSCKIVASKDDEALYFSRNIVPIKKDGTLLNLNEYKNHLGIFIFNKKFLEKYKLEPWKESILSKIEGLEQNSFIENGFRVKLLKTIHKYYGVDNKKMLRKLIRRAT